MIRNNLKTLLMAVVGVSSLVCGHLHAQTVAEPKLSVYDFRDQSCVKSLSDNGQWMVTYGTSATDGSRYTNARVTNVLTGESTVLGLEEDAETPLACTADDVANNGMVAGSYKGVPSVWTKDGGWKNLPIQTGWTSGGAMAITPDGHWAVGYMHSYLSGAENYGEYPMLWDLTTMQAVETPGRPTVGSANETARMVRYTGISADGRYIIGTVDFSYTWNTLEFIYDRQTEKYSQIGFNADGTPWTPLLLGANGIFSPNGKWLAGCAVLQNGTSDETSVPYRYNMETKEIEFFEDSDVRDINGVIVDDNGTLYASTPSNTPIRSTYIHSGKFWYGLDELLLSAYGMDFYAKSGFDNTGTCMSVSGDGKVFAAFPDPYLSYTLQMNETFDEAAAKVNLLGKYSVTPASGSSFSKMKTVTVTFPRDVVVKGNTGDIRFVDENGTAQGRILSFATSASSAKTVTIGFRTLTLTAGMKYTLTIPAGTIALKADETRTNDEITLTYTGRGADPVKVVTASPGDGSSLSQINATTNPILLTFDTNIALTETANASLYREGEETALADLGVAVKDNQMLIFSETTQYLFLNTNYKVVLASGSVTDLNGDNANERYELNYEGLYERIVMADDTLMYKEDFANGVNGMLLYEGDHNTPTAEMQSYDFRDGDNYPWVPLRDDGESDFAAGSTSAYTPAGKSDDWMMTPQIYIPDAKCRLEFQSQGFRSYKQDKLKVIVYASERDINYLTKTEVDEIRANGEVVMDEVVLPGKSEDNLKGDWKTYSFPLNKYAGKSIYVAFVNENENQSIVFVDNIKVIRDNGFLTALTSATTVVGQTGHKIEGRVIANSETQTYTTANIKLLDAAGNVVDEIAESGLSLKKGDRYDFSFAKELPITIGEINPFAIRVQLDDKFDTISYSVKDLAFQPVKRVIVEEMTGQDCGNCPRGHLAWENLERIYGDKVIMAGYHVYTGDSYESGMSSYVSQFLGLASAPSAKIQRGETIGSPTYASINEGKTSYSFTSPLGDCWFDLVQKEFDTDADADLGVTAYFDETAQKVRATATAKFAMNMQKQNIGLFLIITEDGLPGYQHNYHYNDEAEGLGEWGKGGTLGKEYVVYTHNDVVRAQVGSYFGSTGYIPSTITSDKEYKAGIEFNKPAVNEIYNSNVICMMIDANTGAVINVAKAKITDFASGIDGVNAADGNATETARYNAAGQIVTAPVKGLNIIRMSDGTIRKVIVK